MVITDCWTVTYWAVFEDCTSMAGVNLKGQKGEDRKEGSQMVEKGDKKRGAGSLAL